MTWIVKSQPKIKLGCLALLLLGLSAHESSATALLVKNEGPVPVQIGFDGAPPMPIAPRGTARFSLTPGEHSSLCRFEGAYDGCNLGERFTLADAPQLSITLRPQFTLQHAVALAQQGMLYIRTRRDGVWATSALDVPGTANECMDYSAGKLAAVSRHVPRRLQIRNATLAMQNLCGEQRPVIGTMMDGAQLYFSLDFLTFTERNGRPILVRQ